MQPTTSVVFLLCAGLVDGIFHDIFNRGKPLGLFPHQPHYYPTMRMFPHPTPHMKIFPNTAFSGKPFFQTFHDQHNKLPTIHEDHLETDAAADTKNINPYFSGIPYMSNSNSFHSIPVFPFKFPISAIKPNINFPEKITTPKPLPPLISTPASIPKEAPETSQVLDMIKPPLPELQPGTPGIPIIIEPIHIENLTEPITTTTQSPHNLQVPSNTIKDDLFKNVFLDESVEATVEEITPPTSRKIILQKPITGTIEFIPEITDSSVDLEDFTVKPTDKPEDKVSTTNTTSDQGSDSYKAAVDELLSEIDLPDYHKNKTETGEIIKELEVLLLAKNIKQFDLRNETDVKELTHLIQAADDTLIADNSTSTKDEIRRLKAFILTDNVPTDNYSVTAQKTTDSEDNTTISNNSTNGENLTKDVDVKIGTRGSFTNLTKPENTTSNEKIDNSTLKIVIKGNMNETTENISLEDVKLNKTTNKTEISLNSTIDTKLLKKVVSVNGIVVDNTNSKETRITNTTSTEDHVQIPSNDTQLNKARMNESSEVAEISSTTIGANLLNESSITIQPNDSRLTNQSINMSLNLEAVPEVVAVNSTINSTKFKVQNGTDNSTQFKEIQIFPVNKTNVSENSTKTVDIVQEGKINETIASNVSSVPVSSNLTGLNNTSKNLTKNETKLEDKFPDNKENVTILALDVNRTIPNDNQTKNESSSEVNISTEKNTTVLSSVVDQNRTKSEKTISNLTLNDQVNNKTELKKSTENSTNLTATSTPENGINVTSKSFENATKLAANVTKIEDRVNTTSDNSTTVHKTPTDLASNATDVLKKELNTTIDQRIDLNTSPNISTETIRIINQTNQIEPSVNETTVKSIGPNTTTVSNMVNATKTNSTQSKVNETQEKINLTTTNTTIQKIEELETVKNSSIHKRPMNTSNNQNASTSVNQGTKNETNLKSTNESKTIDGKLDLIDRLPDLSVIPLNVQSNETKIDFKSDQIVKTTNSTINTIVNSTKSQNVTNKSPLQSNLIKSSIILVNDDNSTAVPGEEGNTTSAPVYDVSEIFGEGAVLKLTDNIVKQLLDFYLKNSPTEPTTEDSATIEAESTTIASFDVSEIPVKDMKNSFVESTTKVVEDSTTTEAPVRNETTTFSPLDVSEIPVNDEKNSAAKPTTEVIEDSTTTKTVVENKTTKFVPLNVSKIPVDDEKNSPAESTTVIVEDSTTTEASLQSETTTFAPFDVSEIPVNDVVKILTEEINTEEDLKTISNLATDHLDTPNAIFDEASNVLVYNAHTMPDEETAMILAEKIYQITNDLSSGNISNKSSSDNSNVTKDSGILTGEDVVTLFSKGTKNSTVTNYPNGTITRSQGNIFKTLQPVNSEKNIDLNDEKIKQEKFTVSEDRIRSENDSTHVMEYSTTSLHSQYIRNSSLDKSSKFATDKHMAVHYGETIITSKGSNSTNNTTVAVPENKIHLINNTTMSTEDGILSRSKDNVTQLINYSRSGYSSTVHTYSMNGLQKTPTKQETEHTSYKYSTTTTDVLP